MSRIVVARPINGISLNNGREFLLDDRGEIKEFDSVEQARELLIAAGIEPEELRHMTIMNMTHDGRRC